MSPAALSVLFFFFTLTSHAFGSPTDLETDQSTTSMTAATALKQRGYLSIFFLGSFPTNEHLSIARRNINNARVNSGVGAGLKAGIFPSWGKGFIGIEGETFGHQGRLKASMASDSAKGDLIILNTMINVILRYANYWVEPYVGVGGGLSSSYLLNTRIQDGVNRTKDFQSDVNFGYQYLAGFRTLLHKPFFLFGEYKYFSTKHNWKSNGIRTSLTFRAHLAIGGIGISF